MEANPGIIIPDSFAFSIVRSPLLSPFPSPPVAAMKRIKKTASFATWLSLIEREFLETGEAD